jgi:hypothetical protein
MRITRQHFGIHHAPGVVLAIVAAGAGVWAAGIVLAFLQRSDAKGRERDGIS